jgi:hypothetical protein
MKKEMTIQRKKKKERRKKYKQARIKKAKYK